MIKVRIKRAPKTGDQEDYALVQNNNPSLGNSANKRVKNTMTAIPKKEANVEVEGGETVVGDINQDGLLELMSFSGKRHSEGGMPVNLPNGAFIFSDTASLRIKNPEILKYFGMGNSKKGYTPAKISKKYQINEYIDILKDEDADDLSKATANEMLNNNIQKLAELAIYQESMKGMPDGVPDFASSLLPEMAGGGFLDKMKDGEYDISEYKKRHRGILNTYNPAYREKQEEDQIYMQGYTYLVKDFYPNQFAYIDYSNNQGSTSTDKLRTKKAREGYESNINIKPLSIDPYYFNGIPYRVDVDEGDYKSGNYVFIPVNDKNSPPIYINKDNFNDYLNEDIPYKHYVREGNDGSINKYLVSTKPGAVYKPPTKFKINNIEIENREIPKDKREFSIDEPNIIVNEDGKYYIIEKGEERESSFYSKETEPYLKHAWYGHYRTQLVPEKFGWEAPKIIFSKKELKPIYDENNMLIKFEIANEPAIDSFKDISRKIKYILPFTEEDLKNASPFDLTRYITEKRTREEQEAKIQETNNPAQQTKKTSQPTKTTNPSTGFTSKPIKRDGGVIVDEFNTSIFSDILARDKYLNNMDEGGEYLGDTQQSNITYDNSKNALEEGRKELAKRFDISVSLVVTQEEYKKYEGDKSELYILGNFVSDIKEYHGEKPMFEYCSGNAAFPNLESAETQVAGDVGLSAHFHKLKVGKTQVVGNVGQNAHFTNLESSETQVVGDVGGDANFGSLLSAETQVVGDVGRDANFDSLPSATTQITGNVGGSAVFPNLESAETQVVGDVGWSAYFNNLKVAKTQVAGDIGGSAYFNNIKVAKTQVVGDVGGSAVFPNLESAKTQVVGDVGGDANFDSLPLGTTQITGIVKGKTTFKDNNQQSQPQDNTQQSQSSSSNEIVKVTDKDFFKDAEKVGENLHKKDDFGNVHIWDEEKGEYYGFISPDEKISYQWDPDKNHYVGFLRDGSKKPAGYHPPVITKEMQKAVKSSDEYIENTKEFNEQIDNDEIFRDLIIKEYRASYPNDNISDKEIIEHLKEQQIMAVTHDLMYNKYYPEFLEKDAEVPKQQSIWDSSANANNKVYKLSASQFGIEYQDVEHMKKLQRSYAAFYEASHSDEGKNLYGKEEGYWLTPKGAANENYESKRTGKKVSNITQVDGIGGNTHILQYGKFKRKEIPEEEDKTTEEEIPEEEDKTSKFKPKVPDDKEIVPEPDPTFDTWFAPDIMNYLGAVSEKINRYEPSQSKVNLVTPGYSLLDPTRQLAANQESMARYQHMLENSVDPQIALSAALASSGEGAANAANILANVENANVGIVNQAYQQNAAIENSEIMANENARAKYIAEMATLNENMDKAKNLKKWRVINAFNRGWHNFNKDQMMENVLFPQVHTDNITGEVRVKPGRSIEGEDLYVNPMFPGSGNGFNAGALYQYYLEDGFESDLALKLTQIDMNRSKKRNDSYREAYADAYADFDFEENPNEEFGGVFNINDYINL